MKQHDKKEIRAYLEGYLKLKDDIRNAKDHIASLRSIVENCTTHLSFTAGRNPTKEEGKFEDTMIDIVEEERKTEEKIRRLGILQKEIEDLVSLVPDQKQRDVLRYKYERDLPWSRIMKLMNSSERQIYRIHVMALQSAEKIYKRRQQLATVGSPESVDGSEPL